MSADTLSLLGLFLVAVSLLLALYQLRKDYRWRKNERTISFSTYNTEHLRAVYTHLSNHFGDIQTIEEPIKLKEIEDKIALSKSDDEQPDLRRDIHYLLSRYEELGLAVKQGVADFPTAHLLMGHSIWHNVMIFQEYIRSRREATANPGLWIWAVGLAQRMHDTDAKLLNGKAGRALVSKWGTELDALAPQQKSSENRN